MSFLKKVFSPGNQKDDEIMYGTPASEAGNNNSSEPGRDTEGISQGENISKLPTNSEAEKKDHSVLEQVLNPGGGKTDEHKYGGPASTNPAGSQGATTATESRGVTSQTSRKNPSGTLDTPIDTSRLDLDPDTMSSKQYDDQRFDPASSTAAGTATSQLAKRELLQDNQSTLSMKSGALGPYAQQTDGRAAGSSVQNLPDRSIEGNSSSLDNAALAGAGAGTAGVGTAAYGTIKNQPTSTNEDLSTERSFPLGGGTTTESIRPTSSVYSNTSRDQAAGLASTSTHNDPSTASSAPKDAGGLNYGSGSAAAATGGAGAAAAGLVGVVEHQHKGHGHQFDGDPCPPGDEPGLTGPRHVQGPHSTDMANMLDPHVPGEFPSEDGTDPHDRSGLPGFESRVEPSTSSGPSHGQNAALAGGVGATGAGVTEVINDRNAPSSTQTSQPETYKPTSPLNEHHYGRDAALAGGAGVAGLGAYEVINDRNAPSFTNPVSTETPGSSGYPSAQQPAHSTYETGTQPSSTGYPNVQRQAESTSVGGTSAPPPTAGTAATTSQKTSQPEKEHHYGRDAALAGGVGVAGYGLYETAKDGDDTGPASKAIGPHESNLANIVDPRVKPEPEKMKDHTTAGPWQSDTLNKVDPKVTSDPSKADVKAHGYATFPEQGRSDTATEPQQPEHHYGRDAAAVGGVGAAGAAAYGAHEVYDKKEAEKLEKEHAKELEKARKEQAKEAEKQHDKDLKQAEKQHAKDQKEAEKHAKEQAKEVEKARTREAEKAQKERTKEQEKHDKGVAKEEEKHNKLVMLEQEKAEKDQAKEQEKLEKVQAHDSRVAEHDGHNKLHKDPPEEKDKKPSLIHRILHPHAKDAHAADETPARTSVDGENRPKGLDYKDADEARHAQNVQRLEGGHAGTAGGSGVVTDPTTGLPMDTAKYGSGAGGTDGSETIHGYQAPVQSSHTADWEGIKKANTPY